MGHSRKDCPELPAETRTCYVCNSRGHIARNCPKTDENDQSSSKRARGAQSVGITPTVISRKSKKRGRQPAATPMLASTTPAPLIIEAEPSPPSFDPKLQRFYFNHRSRFIFYQLQSLYGQ
ncbi:hypothetical protein G6F61_014499 [Rhizopus arrhizus]|nr:hypothetical protein G6F61_014499 [Rhizopus arrhizus]